MQAKDSSIYLDQYETGSNPDYNVHLASLTSNNNNSHIYIWLADSTLINHIACWHKLFSSYEQTLDATVYRVGGKIIQVEGCRTISLEAQYRVHTCILRLQNVRYIPLNKYNIFALGRWDSQEQRYQTLNGKITLYNCQNMPVLKGYKILSNIYKFHLVPKDLSNVTNTKTYVFTINKPKQSWETWHCCFSYINYKGLKQLYYNKLTDGLMVE